MSFPTHDEISQHAHHLWQNHGCPDGCDTEIWLEAERMLSAEAAAESEIEYHLSPAETEQKSIQAAMQQDEARAPQIPSPPAPKRQPAATGKPLWPRPKSS